MLIKRYIQRKNREETEFIIAVSDAFDAMTSNRPYRKKMVWTQAIAEIQRCRGSQFAPEVTDVFLNLADNGAFDYNCPYGIQGLHLCI